ncbi:MAG: hypothetical protein J5I59_09040 [Saprospiraceae bacterium]|nr:hypothetical protein [Saprospiraceae bacterium]
MAKYFDSISSEDKQILKEAFVNITLLIASSDNKLTQKEIDEAVNTVKVRGYEANSLFSTFYDEINATFREDLEKASHEHSIEKKEIDYYARKISRVNPILERLPSSVAKKLYKDYKSFAHRIANADGGFLGFAKVTIEEKNLIRLPMIIPAWHDDEEEE